MALLVDQSRSVLPLRSAKAREFGELWREKCTRVPWNFPLRLAKAVLLGRPEQTNKRPKFTKMIPIRMTPVLILISVKIAVKYC